MPFQYENYESRKMSGSEPVSKDADIKSADGNTTDRPSEDNPRSSQATTSSMHSVQMASRMKALLVTVPSPRAPVGPAEASPRQQAGKSPKKHKKRTSQGSAKKRKFGGNNKILTSTSVAVKEPESSSPISQVNLRVGSMTVSKWLTFGHVLFSPAREEILNLEDSTNTPSILVIDGLGNGKLPRCLVHYVFNIQ
jgi:hypothetical protein